MRDPKTFKTEMVFVRITPKMKTDAEQAAALDDMTLSDWLRWLIRRELKYLSRREEE